MEGIRGRCCAHFAQQPSRRCAPRHPARAAQLEGDIAAKKIHAHQEIAMPATPHATGTHRSTARIAEEPDGCHPTPRLFFSSSPEKFFDTASSRRRWLFPRASCARPHSQPPPPTRQRRLRLPTVLFLRHAARLRRTSGIYVTAVSNYQDTAKNKEGEAKRRRMLQMIQDMSESATASTSPFTPPPPSSCLPSSPRRFSARRTERRQNIDERAAAHRVMAPAPWRGNPR